MRERLIGIDAGGTTTKAALFDLQGEELACERRSNHMLFPAPGHTERDPDRMWNAACEAVSGLLASTGTAPTDIAAVACSGYGSGLYVVDRDGNPVRPGIVSTDSRAAALVEEWRRQGLADPVAARVGQRLWAGQSLPLLGWLTRHEPGLLDRAHSILFCKDFLRGRLTGELSTDFTDAGVAGMIDIVRGEYAADVFEQLGLGAWLARMPPIGGPCDIAGAVTSAAARVTGLREGTPVVRGILDVTASAIAAGVTQGTQLSVVAGTFSINSTLHAAPRTSTMPFLQSAFPIGTSFLATEGGATSASNLEWFCKQILGAEAVRAVSNGRTIYDVCNGLVGDALGGGNDILFFPFLFGGPANAPAGLLGLSAAHALGDVLRAIYEGIAFAHRRDIEVLLSGPDAAKPTSARLAGGAARSPLWAQMFADVLGMPVETTRGSELGAKGTAICAAVAVGAYPDLDGAVAAMTTTEDRYEPQAGRRDMLAAKYRRYAAVCDAMAPIWSQPADAHINKSR